MPRERLRDGGTFTWAMQQMPTNFNYNQIDGSNFDGAQVIGAMMPVTFDNDATGAPVWNHDFLASEPTLSTTNGQVVTYEINPKAAWYDGTPITWEDFYWQWKSNNGTDEAYRISAANGYENIRSVERGKDDREVIVTYDPPYADWQGLFSPFYPASTNKDPEIFNEGWADHPLTTAGPFKFDSLNRTTQTITLVRNEKWWGAPPKLERMVFRAIDQNAQIDALANGEVDAVDVGPAADNYRRALGIEGVEVRVAGGPNFRHLTINGTSPVLTDVRVRRALAMAIDRTAIARALLGPLGIAPAPLNNHIYMANQQGYRDNSGDVGKFNPQEAARLLDEAGWTLQGNTRRKDGRVLEIRLRDSRRDSSVAAGIGADPEHARANRRQDEHQHGADQRLLRQIHQAGQFDFTVFAWIGTPYPLSSVKSIYANPTRPAPTASWPCSKTTHASVAMRSTRCSRRRRRNSIEPRPSRWRTTSTTLIWQEVHSLTLYQRPEIYAVKKGLANFGAFGLQQPWPYTDIGWVAQP